MRALEKGFEISGRYQLIEKLGRGGFSEVWKAIDMMADEIELAIKIFAPVQGLDNNGISLFRKEFSLVARISNPYLLKATHFDVFEGSPYLIMPLCQQGSLSHQLFQRGTFHEKQIAEVLYPIASALDYLHSREPEILHQDIKPDNILLDDDGNYLLADFGISSRFRNTVRRTGFSSSALTIAYAPPERFSSRPVCFKASDIFSLGVVLFELADGDVPWMSNGGLALKKGAEIPELPEGFSRELNTIIRQCMALEPEDRPTAAQLKQYAQQYLTSGRWPVALPDTQEPVIAYPTPEAAYRDTVFLSEPERAMPVSRPKNRVGIVVLLLLLLGMGLFFYFNTPGDKAEQEQTAWIPSSPQDSLATQSLADREPEEKVETTSVTMEAGLEHEGNRQPDPVSDKNEAGNPKNTATKKTEVASLDEHREAIPPKRSPEVSSISENKTALEERGDNPGTAEAVDSTKATIEEEQPDQTTIPENIAEESVEEKEEEKPSIPSKEIIKASASAAVATLRFERLIQRGINPDIRISINGEEVTTLDKYTTDFHFPVMKGDEKLAIAIFKGNARKAADALELTVREGEEYVYSIEFDNRQNPRLNLK